MDNDQLRAKTKEIRQRIQVGQLDVSSELGSRFHGFKVSGILPDFSTLQLCECKSKDLLSGPGQFALPLGKFINQCEWVLVFGWVWVWVCSHFLVLSA